MLLKGHTLLLSVLVTAGPAGVVVHLRRRCRIHNHSSYRLGDLDPWEEAWPGAHPSLMKWEAACDKSVPPAQDYLATAGRDRIWRWSWGDAPTASSGQGSPGPLSCGGLLGRLRAGVIEHNGTFHLPPSFLSDKWRFVRLSTSVI